MALSYFSHDIKPAIKTLYENTILKISSEYHVIPFTAFMIC